MKEKKSKFCKNNGITLVALVITIIILLILSGIAINSLMNSGLLTKAGKATKISKLKEIEEFARISYMARVMNEITEGKGATIVEVINDLKEKGYKIKEITDMGNKATGIELINNEIVIGKKTTETLIYTIVYEQIGSVRYFTEVEGKDYEIVYSNEEIKINTEETNLENISNKPKVTVESSNSNIIEAKVIEEGKITLTSKELVGNVEITIKEEKSNVTKTITAIVKALPEKLTLSSTEEILTRMSTKKLSATVEPDDVTEEIHWFSSDENIVKVLEDGTIRAVGTGKATVSAKCGNIVSECLIEVTNGSVSFATLESNGYTLEDLFITTEEKALRCVMRPCEKNMKSMGYNLYRYAWNEHPEGNMTIIWDVKSFKEKFGKGFMKLKGTTYYSRSSSRGKTNIYCSFYGPDYWSRWRAN